MASVTVCEIMMTHANFITLTEQMSRMAMNASTSVAQFSQKNRPPGFGRLAGDNETGHFALPYVRSSEIGRRPPSTTVRR
jgi:hypothetical protein